MANFKVQDALTAVFFVAGLIGIGFLGVAFGHSLKPGVQLAMSQHPLFESGIECLTGSVVCSVLLLGFSRRARRG